MLTRENINTIDLIASQLIDILQTTGGSKLISAKTGQLLNTITTFDRMNNRCIVVLSGGQDSTTCLFWALDRFNQVSAVTFDYNQRHRAEIQSAHWIWQLGQDYLVARNYDYVSEPIHEIIQIPNILAGKSPLVNPAENLEQYDDEYSLPGGLEKTFVPMRNQLFLTIAANRAYVDNTHHLITGVCQEDSGGYPDCRQEFIDSFANTSSYGTFTNEADTLPPLVISTPLMNLTKAESIHMALIQGMAYAALAFSHTSYDGAYPPSGNDHATLLRSKGFLEAGLPDPLVIRAFQEGLIPLPDTANYQNPEIVDRVHAMVQILRRHMIEEGND